MSIQIFTRQQFESALTNITKGHHKIWEYQGIIDNEHTYTIPIIHNHYRTNKRIIIRSSIRSDNLSAPSGQDSIQIYLEFFWRKKRVWLPLGKESYTKRLSGWQDRLKAKLRSLYIFGLKDRLRFLNSA